MKKIIFFMPILSLFLITFAGGSSAQIIKVVDGDSLEIGERRIRLDGIDAPEFVQNCTNAEGMEYPCGQMATEYLQQLVIDQNVDCRCLPHTDRYKREICECFINNISLNQTMVQSGWATAYRSAKYQKSELAAQKQKRGIWQGKNMRPAIYRALTKYQKNSLTPPAEHRKP